MILPNNLVIKYGMQFISLSYSYRCVNIYFQTQGTSNTGDGSLVWKLPFWASASCHSGRSEESQMAY